MVNRYTHHRLCFKTFWLYYLDCHSRLSTTTRPYCLSQDRAMSFLPVCGCWPTVILPPASYGPGV